MPHREWGYVSPGMHTLTENGDVPHREWGCVSPGMHILTRNGDMPHRECTWFIQDESQFQTGNRDRSIHIIQTMIFDSVESGPFNTQEHCLT